LFLRKLIKNNKGYLGPIGDDLPSLIPLMFALIIFFSSFYATVNTYNDKTVDFENDIAVVQIGASLRGTGFVSSLEEFKKSCDALNVRQPYFSAGLIDLNKDINVLSLDEDYFFEGSDYFKCSNTEEKLTQQKVLSPNSRIVLRYYPIILQKNSVALPVKLVVVAWKE